MIRIVDRSGNQIKVEVRGVEVDPSIDIIGIRSDKAHTQVERRVLMWMRRNMSESVRLDTEIENIEPVGTGGITQTYTVTLS